MALSNSQYQEIMRDYQAQQLKNKHEQDARVSEIYEILPAVKELDQAVSSRAVQRAKELLNGDQKALERLREEIRDLREQKTILLASRGYPADYMEMKYRCPPAGIRDIQRTGRNATASAGPRSAFCMPSPIWRRC